MPTRDFLAASVNVPFRSRSPFVVLERGVLRVEDWCLTLETLEGNIEIPVGMSTTILLEPGVTVTHEAVKLAAEHDTLLIWTGEAGVRVYSAGNPGGRSAQRIIHQVEIHSNQHLRIAAAKRLYFLMFGETLPETRSIEKLRGMEGARVRQIYAYLAKQHEIIWSSREFAPVALQEALGFASSCLSGLCEAVVLAAGYSPAIGVVHSGNARSLVFDLADTVKFKTVIPLAFQVFKESDVDVRNRVRRRCRDLFREHEMARILFDNLFEIFGECGQ